MTLLYLTPDRIGAETGGGVVTKNEHRALGELNSGHLYELSRDSFGSPLPENPFDQDEWFLNALRGTHTPTLAHCYSGCLGKTVTYLKSIGTKVTYTVAAHDRFVSRKAHEDTGLSFPYPHLTDDALFKEYCEGILLSDLVICPSTQSASITRGLGFSGPIKIVPHGFDYEERPTKYPETFTVGYMGVVGADKGLVTLLKAWKECDFKGGLLKFVGMPPSPYFMDMIQKYGGGNIYVGGWVKNKHKFFDSITVYCQPSFTEGFGIPVLEALGHGKEVLCSTGAGASDLVKGEWKFMPGDVDALVRLLRRAKSDEEHKYWSPKPLIEHARQFTWDKIRQKYIDIWRAMP